MKDILIIDTNVFFFDQQALTKFPNSIIIIPLIVIKELDKYKKDPLKGPNARSIIRNINKVLKEKPVKISLKMNDNSEEEVSVFPLKNGSYLRVEKNNVHELPDGFQESQNNDMKILSVAHHYNKRFKQVKFITNDNALQIFAKVLKIPNEIYDGTEKITEDTEYLGHKTIKVCESTLNFLSKNKEVSIDKIPELSDIELYSNEYICFEHNSKKAIRRFSLKSNTLEELYHKKNDVYGITNANREQYYALDALLNPDIHLVCLTGIAGTGKTLLALAAGLQQTLAEDVYTNILIARPTITMPGMDIGFLPGDIKEKMLPWFKPIYDNLKFLMMGKEKQKNNTKNDKWLDSQLEMHNIEIEPLAYIRGRSIPNQYLIIDEAQNLTPANIKTILTRAAEGTKIILTGDPQQTDADYLNQFNNGLSQTIEKFKKDDSGIFAHIKLVDGQRSLLADKSAKLLG